MKLKMLIAALTLSSMSLVSCKKDATNSGGSSFSYQLKTNNPISTLGKIGTTNKTDAANIQWTAGTASADELKFEASNSSGEIEFKQKSTQQIDLFSASSTLGNITIPVGTYNEVEFKASLSSAGNKPALEISGNFTSAGVTKPIVFRVNSSLEVKAEKHQVTVAQGSLYSALNNIDLSQITNGITETALNSAALTNGTIILSSSSNSDLYNIIINNLNSHHSEAEIEHD